MFIVSKKYKLRGKTKYRIYFDTEVCSIYNELVIADGDKSHGSTFTSRQQMDIKFELIVDGICNIYIVTNYKILDTYDLYQIGVEIDVPLDQDSITIKKGSYIRFSKM